MPSQQILNRVSDGVDRAAAGQVTDMLYAQWGNLRGMLGMGLPENPTPQEFDRMGLEMVRSGKVKVRLSNGQEREITIDQLRLSMESLADNLGEDGRAVADQLREQAAKLEKMKKDSAAMGRIKNAMAEAAEENSGPIMGMSFGNLLGGLFSYLGKMLSWVFSGMRGEMPGFRDTMANYVAGNVRSSARTRLQNLARNDPEAAAVLLSTGNDGRMVIDTLSDGMRDAALREGGVAVPARPGQQPAGPRQIGDINGLLRNQANGANNYNAEQLAAAAMGAMDDNRISGALRFNVGGRRVDLNYGPVRSVARMFMGNNISDAQRQAIQTAMGKRVADIFDKKADEYAALQTPQQRKAFIARELKEELATLNQTEAFRGAPLTDDMMNQLSDAMGEGITDPANAGNFRILPRPGAIAAPAPVRDLPPGTVQTLEQVFTDIAADVRADPMVAPTIATLPAAEAAKLQQAQDTFVATAARITRDNPTLAGDALADRIRTETETALKSQFGVSQLDANASAILGLLDSRLKSGGWQERIVAARNGQASSAAPGAPAPEVSPEQRAQALMNSARPGVVGELTRALDPNTGEGRFMRELFTRRNGGVPGEQALRTIAEQAVSPELTRDLVADGALVRKKPGSNDYEMTNEQALENARTRISASLEGQIRDPELRAAMAEQMAEGLLTRTRPGFTVADESRSATRTMLTGIINERLGTTLSSAEGQRVKPLLDRAGITSDRLPQVSEALARGLMNMRQPQRQQEIRETIARMNAQEAGSGDKWGFEHAAHVMRDQIDAIQPPIPAGPVREAVIRMALAEMKDGIPGSERWPQDSLREGKLTLAKEAVRSQMLSYTNQGVLDTMLGQMGGMNAVVDRVGPLLLDESFMALSTEQKRTRLHQELTGGRSGVAGADTAAFVLAFSIDNKSFLNSGAAVDFVADKPLPYIEVTPRQIGSNIQHGLNSIGSRMYNNLPSWMK